MAFAIVLHDVKDCHVEIMCARKKEEKTKEDFRIIRGAKANPSAAWGKWRSHPRPKEKIVGGPEPDILVGGFGNDTEIQDEHPSGRAGRAAEREFSEQAGIHGLQFPRNDDGQISALDALIIINQFAPVGSSQQWVGSDTVLPFDIHTTNASQPLILSWLSIRSPVD